LYIFLKLNRVYVSAVHYTSFNDYLRGYIFYRTGYMQDCPTQSVSFGNLQDNAIQQPTNGKYYIFLAAKQHFACGCKGQRFTNMQMIHSSQNATWHHRQRHDMTSLTRHKQCHVQIHKKEVKFPWGFHSSSANILLPFLVFLNLSYFIICFPNRNITSGISDTLPHSVWKQDSWDIIT